ncbi:transglycosylase domain-containing protein [uncultured Lutibacter sp.]|uniref:transglycosylase domain-containing protein n=1 Tax=uncultured Lutibacter sp. TaxID=437739 RepID=UPI002605FA53|nr:transglycosylase domain-containing protein [uncultured Lutibacter sp.]
MQLKIQIFIKQFLKYFAIFITTVILSIGLLFLLVYFGVFGSLPDKNTLTSISNEEASQVISSDNILIGKFFAENRTNILWEEVPEHLKNALIATEDKRFYTHKGYDTKSYFRVLLKSVFLGNSSSGGGSTLTQQLVKNLYGRNNYGILSLPVSKIKELIIASKIENIYTKEELLLLYLNSVPFGENVYGVEAASRRYFNKSAKQLKVEESAVLVGLLKANTYFNPRLNPQNSLDRRNLVLNLMEKQHYLSAKVADSLQKSPLKLDYENVDLKATTGYFVYQVKKKTLELLETVNTSTGKEYNLEKDGLKIYTTLNMQVQELASDAIKKQLTSMQQILDKELENHQFKKQWYAKQKQKTQAKDLLKRNVEVLDWEGMQAKNITKIDSLWHYYKMLNAAVLISNPKNGAVISWVGGNHFRTLPFDMVLSHRQIASAFKPILYATALENGFTACSYLENEEKIYSEFENWEPKNFDHISTPNSNVALWYSLTHSMNLPTVDLYFKLGRENLLNICKKLNFPLTKNDAPSIALGTLDLSLAEIVEAYGAFANKGQTNELLMIDKITDAKGNILYIADNPKPIEVFSIETSQMITAILQQAIYQGTGTKIRSQYGIKADLAGKTGTAQNYSDAWFVAYTPDLVLGTWVGASKPDVHFYSGKGSGSSLALPIVAQVIKGIEKDDALRKKYLTSFAFPDADYSFMECEPYRETGIEGFFNRLFNNKAKTDADKDKKEKKLVKKSFFDKLFKRNQ